MIKNTKICIILMVFAVLPAIFTTSCGQALEEAESTVQTLEQNETEEESRISRRGESRPFPQQLTYPGAIKPNHLNQATLNLRIKDFYGKWASQYYRTFTRNGRTFGYVKQLDWDEVKEKYIPMTYQIEEGGPKYEAYGSSEGLGYGMIITALMAGPNGDPNARTKFDQMLNTYMYTRSQENSGLMSWVIPKQANYPKSSSATDGDMDVAYALCLAYKQWGGWRYYTWAQRIIDMINYWNRSTIYNSPMGGTEYRLNLGDWVQHLSSGDEYFYEASRPSDWMPGHMEVFYEYVDRPWKRNIITKLKQSMMWMAGRIYVNYSRRNPLPGLMPDFIWKKEPRPVNAKFMEGAHDGKYYYNACRFPLRYAVAWAHHPGNDNDRMHYYNHVRILLGGIMRKTNNNPGDIYPGYDFGGNPIDTSYKATCFSAPLVAACIINADSRYQGYLNSGFNISNVFSYDYFNDSISMLSMLLMTGNWWRPSHN